MRIANLFDVTLRDGALGLNFPYSLEQSADYVRLLAEVGVGHAEVGFVHSPATGFPPEGGFNAHVDGDDLQSLVSVTNVTLHRMIDGDNPSVEINGGSKPLPPTRSNGLLRLTCRASDLSDVRNLGKLLIDDGHRVAINLKHCGTRSDDDIMRAAGGAMDLGAEVFYVVDTSGSMTPIDVARLTSAAVQAAPTLAVGFHGHDNLGFAVANSVAAFDSGATLIDASLGGTGAGGGNTPLEAMVLLCDDTTVEAWVALMKGYGILRAVSPELGHAAFWGYVGVDSVFRAKLIDQSTTRGEDPQVQAWSRTRGTNISMSGHSRVDVLRDGRDESVVRKTELNDGARLAEEIAFCRTYQPLGASVSRVIDEGFFLGRRYYDMPEYRGRLLSQIVLTNDARAEQHIRSALSELKSLWETAAATADILEFTRSMYLERPSERLRKITTKWTIAKRNYPVGEWFCADAIAPSDLLSLIASAPGIDLEGSSIVSTREIPGICRKVQHVLTPESESMVTIHGDPHFGNIIMARGQRPVLLDPSGFMKGGDAAYDLGKVQLSLGPHDHLLEGNILPFEWRVHSDGLSIRGLNNFKHESVERAWRRVVAGAADVVRETTPSNVRPGGSFEDRVDWTSAIHHVAIAPTLESRGWAASAILLEGLVKISACVVKSRS
ncbi:hypothetical protein [Microbacterium sp. P04]|uniref:hypothetical protein n=1 Tax=Microbacterium sp. P04 TaxID=3366947 RepID=UPI0037466EB2